MNAIDIALLMPARGLAGIVAVPATGAATPADMGQVMRVLMPKVGYVFMFNNVLGFWFRGGPSFVRVGSSDGTDSRIKESVSFWLLSLDALLVVSPVQHFAFYVGPQGDISFAGSHSRTNVMGITQSNNMSFRDIGIGTGLIGYLDL